MNLQMERKEEQPVCPDNPLRKLFVPLVFIKVKSGAVSPIFKDIIITLNSSLIDKS